MFGKLHNFECNQAQVEATTTVDDNQCDPVSADPICPLLSAFCVHFIMEWLTPVPVRRSTSEQGGRGGE